MTQKNLTAAQRKAIEALLTSGNITAAAAAAGVSRNALYKWQRDDTFIVALRDAESEAVAGLSRALAGLGDGAAAALRDALDNSQKITVRLRAAEIVATSLLRLRELVNLEQRLLELEKRT
jgi:transposase-like protein